MLVVGSSSSSSSSIVVAVVHLLKPWLRLFSSDNNAEWVVKSSELTYEH